MKVIILRDFDLRIHPLQIKVFKASPEPITTKRAWGEQLVAAGAAEEVEVPPSSNLSGESANEGAAQGPG